MNIQALMSCVPVPAGINGFLYGNLPGLDMCLDDRVVWHVFSVGSELDVHSVYFHGQPLTLLDTHRSATVLLPGYFKTLFMKAENPGRNRADGLR